MCHMKHFASVNATNGHHPFGDHAEGHIKLLV